jgi:hypothetical protein
MLPHHAAEVEARAAVAATAAKRRPLTATNNTPQEIHCPPAGKRGIFFTGKLYHYLASRLIAQSNIWSLLGKEILWRAAPPSSNQAMNSLAPLRNQFVVIAATPCAELSFSR